MTAAKAKPTPRKRAAPKPKPDPPEPQVQTLTAAVASGDPRQALEALRDRLASEIDTAGEKGVAVLAQVAAQLRATLKDISELPVKEEKVTVADDLAARRKDRRAAAKAAASAAGTEAGG